MWRRLDGCYWRACENRCAWAQERTVSTEHSPAPLFDQVVVLPEDFDDSPWNRPCLCVPILHCDSCTHSQGPESARRLCIVFIRRRLPRFFRLVQCAKGSAPFWVIGRLMDWQYVSHVTPVDVFCWRPAAVPWCVPVGNDARHHLIRIRLRAVWQCCSPDNLLHSLDGRFSSAIGAGKSRG